MKKFKSTIYCSKLPISRHQLYKFHSRHDLYWLKLNAQTYYRKAAVTKQPDKALREVFKGLQ